MISEEVHNLFRIEITNRYGKKQGVVSKAAQEAFLLWVIDPNAESTVLKAVKQKKFPTSSIDTKPTRDPANVVQVETVEPITENIKSKTKKNAKSKKKKSVKALKKESLVDPVQIKDSIVVQETEPEPVVILNRELPPVTIPDKPVITEAKVDPEPHGIQDQKLEEPEVILNPNDWLTLQKDKPYAELQKECVRLVTKGDGYSLTCYELLMNFMQVKFSMQVMKPE